MMQYSEFLQSPKISAEPLSGVSVSAHITLAVDGQNVVLSYDNAKRLYDSLGKYFNDPSAKTTQNYLTNRLSEYVYSRPTKASQLQTNQQIQFGER